MDSALLEEYKDYLRNIDLLPLILLHLNMCTFKPAVRHESITWTQQAC